jgi:hypothetical protein
MAKDSYARPQKSTKAELHAMLAEAVRNTQPQPEPEPVRDAQPEPRHRTQPRNTRQPAPKCTVKIKRVRR